MRAVLMLLLVAAAPAAKGPVAISCDQTLTEEGGSIDTWPNSPTKAKTQIYVLDDTKKLISFYNKNTGSLDPVCRDCEWSYGPAKVTYNHLRDLGGGTSSFSTFEIDRTTGKYHYDSLILKNARSHKMVWDGVCTKTTLPKKDVNTKF